MKKSPCKGCTERHKGCHSSCEAYKAYDEENKRRLDAAHMESGVAQYHVDNVKRSAKMANRLRQKNGKEW